MARFGVYSSATVSMYHEIEADSPEDAIEQRYLEGWPGLMFLDHTYPNEGDWEVDEDVEFLDEQETGAGY